MDSKNEDAVRKSKSCKYILGDPLNLLSFFVPIRYTEILYHVLVIVRLYLAGIAFYVYCLYHSYESRQILPGVLIYVFSF